MTAVALEKASPKQVDEVQQRTQQVVPYALDQTQLTFTRTVHAAFSMLSPISRQYPANKIDPGKSTKMANDFRRGDFLWRTNTWRRYAGASAVKKAETDDIKYEYKELPNGAQIHYSTEYPQYVQALHEWFDAQMSEHGNEVIPNIFSTFKTCRITDNNRPKTGAASRRSESYS